MKLPDTDPTRVVLLNQREIALSQLDRAALLFLQEKDFVSSVTLACAAEGIFGEYLKERGINPHVEELKSVLKANFAQDLSLSLKLKQSVQLCGLPTMQPLLQSPCLMR